MQKLDKEQMDCLKMVELDILKYFIKICEELDLCYFAVAGTLLGAVRHNGFIPWDDDIDIGMPREDYETFKEKASQYLPKYIFLQNYDTDPEFTLAFSKLRNSNTTFIETSVKNRKINHGVFIDIFPIDYYPESKINQVILRKYRWLCGQRLNSLRKDFDKLTLKRKIGTVIARILWKTEKRMLVQRDYIYKAIKKSSLKINYSGPWGNREILKSKWLDEQVKLRFEDISISVPANYHEYLTAMYGDYMTPPPPQKQITHHYTEVIDLSKSYKEYTGT